MIIFFKKQKIIIFLIAYVFIFADASFCFAENVLKIPAPPIPGSVKLPEYLTWVFNAGIGIGFFSVAFALIASGVFFLLSGGLPSMRSKAKDWLSGAISGFLIFEMLYLIITTIYPPLAIFKFGEALKTPNICPNSVTNADGTIYCPPSRLHGVYLYEGSSCGGDYHPTTSSISNFGEFAKKPINSAQIIQDTKNGTYYIALIYDTQNYYGQCQYITPDESCNDLELENPAKSASVYVYNYHPAGTVTFYRNGVFDENGGYLTLQTSDINKSDDDNLYEVELKTLRFTGNHVGSPNIADCTVPEDQQDCIAWDKNGNCTQKECPTLANNNISSIEISGDYLVVLEYLKNGPSIMGDFCQAYPKDADINKIGPKQVKWDPINNAKQFWANYVLIIPIKKN